MRVAIGLDVIGYGSEAIVELVTTFWKLAQ
jgi:hypothetical protein